LNIAASEGRGGRGEELIRSMLSSLERDAGGVTAIVAAPANSAAATAIFKHVDIEVTASLDLLHPLSHYVCSPAPGKKICSLTCEARVTIANPLRPSTNRASNGYCSIESAVSSLSFLSNFRERASQMLKNTAP
jgi:hypothetical protein